MKPAEASAHDSVNRISKVVVGLVGFAPLTPRSCPARAAARVPKSWGRKHVGGVLFTRLRDSFVFDALMALFTNSFLDPIEPE